VESVRPAWPRNHIARVLADGSGAPLGRADHMVELVVAIAAALSGGNAVDFFAVIGFFATLGAVAWFIGKLIDEHKRNKLADEGVRRLREERSRERLQAEWKNMTTAGTPRGGVLGINRRVGGPR
jgi:hypothetical protein